MLKDIPATFTAANDREAFTFIAARRDDETVALFLVSPNEYRIHIFTNAEAEEAGNMAYDYAALRDGFEQVAYRHLRDGERLISVH